MLEAWKILKNEGNTSKLIICGNGPEERWCERFINDNHLDNVKLNGFVSNSDVKNILSFSKVMVIPTELYEGFPMTIVEAFSTGTPVICSDIGNAADLVQEGVTGIKFHCGSPIALARVIDNIKQYSFDPNKISEMYKLNFDAEQNYRKLLKIYWNINDGKCHCKK